MMNDLIHRHHHRGCNLCGVHVQCTMHGNTKYKKHIIRNDNRTWQNGKCTGIVWHVIPGPIPCMTLSSITCGIFVIISVRIVILWIVLLLLIIIIIIIIIIITVTSDKGIDVLLYAMCGCRVQVGQARHNPRRCGAWGVGKMTQYTLWERRRHRHG